MVSTQHASVGNTASSGVASSDMITTLLSVESALASEEAQLVVQLEAIQKKRQSLQTVIQLFAEPAASGQADAADHSESVNGTAQSDPVSIAAPMLSSAEGLSPASPALDNAQSLSQDPLKPPTSPTKTSPMETSPIEAPASGLPAPAKAQTKPVSKPVKSSSKRRKRTIKGARSNKSKVTVAPWQFHVRKEYKDISLPKAVLNVLQGASDDVVEISDIIAKIFVSDIPDEAQASARDRLSNILSVGLKKGQWYRGRTGHYSVSKAAAQASAARRAT